MEQQQFIADIEARAAFIGVSIAELCRSAGIHPTLFAKWKRTPGNQLPVNATFNSLAKLRTTLDVFEKENGERTKAQGAPA